MGDKCETGDRSAVSQASLEAIPGVGTYVWHIREDRLEWSPNLVGIYGLDVAPEEEFDFMSQVNPDDRVRVEAETVAYLAEGTHYDHEFRIVRPDGDIRMVHDRGVIERSRSGEAIIMRGLNIDVTKRTAAQQKTYDAAQLESFRTLADNIDQLAWMADGSGSIYWYNKRWFDFTGTSLAEMHGWGWTRVHHPDYVDRVVERIRHSFETGEPWEDTFPLKGRNGQYRWFLSRAQAIRGEDGRIVRWFGTNTDITQSLAAEERLKHSEERFRTMADSMPQLVWTASSDGTVDYYNSEITNFASVRNPRDGRFDWTILIHPDDLAETMHRWETAASALREFSCEHRLHMADDSFRWHLSRAKPVVRDKLKDVVWYGTATDIDELKRLQEHRTLLSEELAHRVKNTLGIVQNMANQTFRHLKDDGGAAERFKSRLRALAGAHDILVRDSWSEVSLREICQSTTLSLGAERRVTISGADLVAPPRAGVMLALALHELGTNAMKYGSLSRPEGRVEVFWQLGAAGFQLNWEEFDGPPVGPPENSGFGSQLLTKALALEIDGDVRMEFDPAGLKCRMLGSFNSGIKLR